MHGPLLAAERRLSNKVVTFLCDCKQIIVYLRSRVCVLLILDFSLHCPNLGEVAIIEALTSLETALAGSVK